MAEFTLVDQEDFLLTPELPADAVDLYKRSVDANHNNPEILNAIGDQYLRSGRVQEAISCFSQVAKQYAWQRQTTKAIAVLKKMSRLTPSDPDIMIRIGDLLAAEGRQAEARATYVCAGDSQYIDDQPLVAMTAYEKAVGLDGSNAALHMMLGGLYREQQMLSKAHASFVTARREYLKKGEISLARHAAATARSIEGLSLLSSPASACRRREERFSMRLPAVVMAENRKWCEQTISVDISKSGIRLSVARPLEPDRVVGLLMRVPPQVGLGTADDGVYAVDAMVCHTKESPNGKYLIGAEFGSLQRVCG